MQSKEKKISGHICSQQWQRWFATSQNILKKNSWRLGLLCAGVCGVVGAGLLYLENDKLQQSLRVVSDAATSQDDTSYIYIDPEIIEKQEKKITKNRVLFPYLQSRSHDPHTLLRLALSEEHAVRLLGVKALSQPHHWTDADYHMLAQALDSRALIGLARMPNSDSRFFLPQPKLHKTEELLEDQLRHLLLSLPMDNLDQCTKYFTSSALQEGNQSKKDERGGLWCFGGNGLAFTQSLSPVPDEIVETFCLQALEKHSFHSLWSFDGTSMLSEQVVTSSVWLEMLCLHAILGASSLPSHCSKIVQLGGLRVLQRMYEVRQNSIKISRSIARILANLAVHNSLHGDITKLGWLGVLHKWLNSTDLALSLHAARALANLDMDFAGHKKYMDGVYLYYPQKRYSEPVYADIVFVHGLMGGPFRTWRQKDTVLKQLREKKEKQKKEKQNNSKQQQSDVNNNNIMDKSKQTVNTSVNTTNDNTKTFNKSQSSTENTADVRTNDKQGTNKNNDIPEDTDLDVMDTKSKSSVSDTLDKVKNKVKRKFSPLKSYVKDLVKGDSRNPRESDLVKKPRKIYTFCWPKDWLSDDIPNVRILTVEYDTHLSEWAPKCPYEGEKRALATRSKELLEKLRTAGIGDRPVIWLGHSMGGDVPEIILVKRAGLLIKQMLVNAATDPRFSQMVDNTQGIVFYSVPHKGSPLAVIGNSAKYLFNPSVEVKELRKGSPHLLDLHAKFKDLVFEKGTPILSFAEGSKTDLPLNMKVIIVPPESSDPEFGEFYKMEDLNHLNICKPENDHSAVYQMTLAFLQDCIPVHRVPNILKATVPDEYVLSEEEVS